jgi:hemoglobin
MRRFAVTDFFGKGRRHWPLAFAALAGCSSVAPDLVERDAANVPPVDATLYRDLGGKAGVAKLVDALVVHYRADKRINILIVESDIPYFTERLNEYVCMRAGGGCEYKGLSMLDVHSGMDIKESEFNYFVEDSQTAMRQIGLSISVQNRLLALLAHDQPDVIRQ